MNLCTLAAFGLATFMAIGSAQAYPYFQTSSGTDTCGMCHVSPAGGGPLSEWGRGETGDTLALGGNGAFLHGLVELPGWFDLGGDVRLASLVNDTGNTDGAEIAVFPMQLELGVRASSGAWNLIASAGVLGAVRDAPAEMTATAPQREPLPWLMSREHYVMWRPGDVGAYVRAGRFSPPYGLRLADHTTYVRRQLGFGLYEEPYAVSAGHLGEAWDVHVTAFASDRWRWAPRQEVGGAVMVERRLGRLVGTVNGRAAHGEGQTRAMVGLTAKLWRERTSILWMAEVDAGWHWMPGLDRPQLTAYEGIVWFPVRGLSIGTAYQRHDEDVGRADDTRHAADVWFTLMPRAHVEVGVSSRYQWIGPEGRAAMAMLQVHYFL